MKRYDADMWRDSMYVATEGEWVKHSDAVAAIEAAKREETERLQEIGAEFSAAIKTREGRILGAMIEQGVTALQSHIEAVIYVASAAARQEERTRAAEIARKYGVGDFSTSGQIAAEILGGAKP